MDLTNINGLILMPSASETEIFKVENELNVKLPISYKDLLKTSNGLSSEEGILIYGTEDIRERNDVWETKVYAKGYVAIGDNGGGQVFLMQQGDQEKEVLMVDTGDMNAEHSGLVTSNLSLWVTNGFTIKENEMQEERSRTDICKIVLINSPDGGLKDLLKIKKVFGLNTPANELIKGLKNLPYTIVEGFPYGKAMKLVEKLKDLKIELRID
ncbi:1,3-beta-glucan synthase regulator [Bacillus sp. AFS001701]|uniref:SMI1/KNR4 family protein n=1 Tax=Bacillaceae TaxID=186817 RepID=UPI000BF4B64A|nr:SMI1/KNR4 family protein [Bacillus sp. AFS001701]PET46839.1 1,3-beta-glucan synthase regulator [Bacillus sp. AFS001701]